MHKESHHQKQARHQLALWFAETKPLDNPMNFKGNVVQPLVRKPQQLAPGERLPPRLALKKLLLQDQTGARIQGSQRDLETEISILLQLGSYDANTKKDPDHNNIVKIFAIGTAQDYQSNNHNNSRDDTRYNFFVMDWLVPTLSSCMNTLHAFQIHFVPRLEGEHPIIILYSVLYKRSLPALPFCA
jgi:hypothetical protein